MVNKRKTLKICEIVREKETGAKLPLNLPVVSTSLRERDIAQMPVEDVQKLVHELQEHQVEQEMQNDELRRAQVELEAARDRFTELYDFAPVGYLTLNEAGVIQQANLTVAGLLGVSRERLISKKLTDFLTAASQETFHLHQQLSATSLGKKICKLEFRRQDGSIFYGGIESVVNPVGHRKHPQLFVAISDHTSLKRCEDSLKENECELAAIYDNTPLIMLMIDGSRRVCKMNRFAEEFSGGNESRLLGRRPGRILHCIHALDHPKGCGFGPHCEKCPVRRAVIDALEMGRSLHRVETSLEISHQGQTETVAVLFSTVRLDLHGQPHALVTIQDITERKRTEKELHRSGES